ncbi:MAG: hypothetical protein EP329_03605 [Deltaproteobacteria bacterium]|nr:MAG: hypothetical protein EP329_03605 [Deltaproteobacteria bacterium]
MKKTLAVVGLVALSAGLFVVACGGNNAPPKEDFPALGQPATIKILSAGEGAKAPLRWKAQKGIAEKMSMVLDTKMDITAGGQSMAMSMGMTMDMDGKVLDVMADGSSKVSMTVTGASMKMDMPGMPSGNEASDMLSEMLKGMTIEATMDARGGMTDTKVSGGSDLLGQMTDQMDSSFDQMAIPFPEEAVSVGAKWQALTTQESNGMKVRMVATYELVKLEGDKGQVKLAIQQFADAQTIDMNGTSADVKSLKSSGSGNMEFDLARPMLAKAEIDLKMDASMEIMGQDADMKVDAKVTMTPKGPIADAPAPEKGGEVAPE